MARTLEVSPTVAMAQRAAARRASGKDVLDFSVGEPDQPTPPHVVAAGTKALEAGRTKYPPAAGLPELRSAVASRYRSDYGVGFGTEEVAITVGGKQAYYLVCRALLGPGDEMVIPTPHWPTFSEAVRLAGAKPILVPTKDKDGFAVTAKLVAKGLTSRTKVVLLNSPANPTGAVLPAEEMARILNLAKKKKFTVLYDDTYAQLTYGPHGPLRLEGLREEAPDRLVVIGTASKTYCMTGWRIGWVLGPRALVDACAAFCSHSTQGPSTFGGGSGGHERSPGFRGPPAHGVPAASGCDAPLLEVDPRSHLQPSRRRLLFLPKRLQVPGPGPPHDPGPQPAPARRDGSGGRARRGLRCPRPSADLLRAVAPGAGGGGATDRQLPGESAEEVDMVGERVRGRSFSSVGLEVGTSVVLYLQSPKEKVFGLLLTLDPSGVTVRGLDLQTFDDWMRQEARDGDPELGLATLFYPMHRVERVERDETIGQVPGYADRFAREVGQTIRQVLGLED
jgi:histidinol-phosphate/aromatic aminotransferase/cobyric acid decarboxylase-like protein